MKILVTGSSGFIGKNLCLWLRQAGYDVLSYDLDTKQSLESLVNESNFIFHLAGINRPITKDEFYEGNSNLTLKLAKAVEATNRDIPICLASSIQAALDNDYGKSKKLAEDYLLSYSKQTGHRVYIFRLQNAFGKWCKPNYNSVVATFCFNIANGLPISINDRNVVKEFVYIDDICKSFVSLLNQDGTYSSEEILTVKPSYKISIGELADMIFGFKASRENLIIPNVGDEFSSKLYATYLSYLEPGQGFSYNLVPHIDARGSFTEFFRTTSAGQLSINISKPGITKGNHFHNTKNEKFLVIHGLCLIKFRKIGTDTIFEYKVSGDDMKVVDIPCGYTHSITNIGSDDSITLMWASELFDKDNPDTFYEEV